MTATDPVLTASRICNASRVVQAADDVDVTGWAKTDAFILCIQFDSQKGPWTAAYRIEWQKDGGSWNTLGATGEMKYTTSTVLTDGTDVTSTTKRITNVPIASWVDALDEIEDGVQDSVTLADEEYSEMQVGIDPADSTYSSQYTFRVYDTTNSAVVGTCLAQLTIEAEPYVPVGVVFSDGFEDGTDDAWTSQGGTPVVSASGLASTDYKLDVAVSTTEDYEVKTFATAIGSGVTRARFYIDPNGQTNIDSDVFVLSVENASGAAFYVFLDYDAGFQIRAALVDDTPSNNNTSYYAITDAEHYVEVLAKRATSAVAADGSLQLWIDGVSKETVSGIDNYDRWGSSLTLVEFGNTYYPGTITGDIFVDEFVIRDDDTEIGSISGVNYKSLAGVLTFVGSLAKKTKPKTITGGLTFIGSLAKKVKPKAIQGAISFIGNVTSTATFYRTFGGAISFVGSMTPKAKKSLAGSITPSGNVVKKTKKFFAGALTFIGTVTTVTTFHESLDGEITFTGSVVKKTITSVAGAITFVGSLVKSVGKAISGAFTSSGTLAKLVKKSFAGSISFVGGLSAIKLGVQNFKSLAGAITFTGVATRKTKKPLSGSATFAGTVVKEIAKSLTGAFTPSGILAKKTSEALSGTIAFAGEITKKTKKLFAGAVTFIGDLSTVKQSVSFFKSLAGTITFGGVLVKETAKTLIGALTSSGNLVKKVEKLLVGEIAPTGTVVKSTKKLLVGTIAPSGTVTTTKIVKSSSAGALMPTGTVTTVLIPGTGVVVTGMGPHGRRARWKPVDPRITQMIMRNLFEDVREEELEEVAEILEILELIDM